MKKSWILLALFVGCSKPTGDFQAFKQAAKRGEKPIVVSLLKANPKLAKMHDDEGHTALHDAVWNGHKEIVQILLDNKADVDVELRPKNLKVRAEIWGSTPLHYAVIQGYPEIVEMLLQQKADINLKPREGEMKGWTVLYMAAFFDKKDIVEILLNRKANIEGKNENGSTPLHGAIGSGGSDTVEFLLLKGANPNTANKDGITPLHLAAFHGNRRAVELLLAVGANLNAKDFEGKTPQDVALKAKKSVTAELLRWAASGWTSGRVIFEGKMKSKTLGDERMIHLYLPPSYEREPNRRFPVLYLHDGQNVFSTAGPQAAFGWGPWMLDKTVDDLSAAGKMQEIIMVGVDCSASRYIEYRGPAYRYTDKELQQAKTKFPPPQEVGDNTRFEKYSRFLIEELKPRIDREYRTLPDPAHTGVMGSSMGGICSTALSWEHPEVFGRCASLSGWFAAEEKTFLINTLRKYDGKPKPFRIYLDSGVKDHIGGDDCQKETAEVVAELKRIGWDNMNLLYFLDKETIDDTTMDRLQLTADKRREAQRSQHNELYWRLRVNRALTFLFPPK